MCPLLLCANNGDVLCIHEINGHRTYLFFQSKPRVVIMGNELEITTKDEIVNFPLDNIAKFTFENGESTSVDSFRAMSYSIKNDIITSKGKISVFDMSGKVVAQSESGEVNLSKSPKGIYLIRTGNASFKYFK